MADLVNGQEVATAGSQFLTQVMTEYNEGQDFLRLKKLKQVQQLVLFNNLQRTDQSIASTTLFSFFNRVFSNIYSDVLQFIFMPSEDAEYKKTETLNKMIQSDYQEMEMWKLNYDWTWDACFFGAGYMETLQFDKQRKVMKPVVVNPLYIVHDPYFSNPSEWRYYYKWRTFSRHELIRLKKKKVISESFDITRISPGLEVELWDYKNQRDAARLGTNVNSNSIQNNDIYQILEGFTFDDEGNKLIVWTDKNFSQEIRKEKLSKYIPDDEPWPIVKKQIFREPHSSLEISVPDIVEDKHRAKSVLMNLLFLAAKDDANPIYLYNPDHVLDVTQLYQRQILQHIPVDDLDKAIRPMNTKPAMNAAVNSFISLLSSESSEAIGTAIVQPNMQRGKKSATESAMLQQIADLTSSLQAKVVAMAEREFGSHWYLRSINPRNIKASDEKIIKLSTVTGITFESIKIGDWKTKYPPVIRMVSKKEAEYKELVLRRDLMQNLPVLIKTMDPKALQNFLKYVYLPKFGMDSQTIDMIVPSSIDQIKARQENELLSDNKFVPVDPMDDDEAHMYEHMMAKKTPAMWAHYFIHEKHRAIKKKMAEEQQKQEGQDQAKIGKGQGSAPPGNGAPDQIPVQKDKQNPDMAAVPLGKEMSNDSQQKGRILA